MKEVRSMTLRNYCVVLGIFMIFLTFTPIVSAAQSTISEDTPVLVAEDKTAEVDCGQWEGTPSNRRPCDPGTVIIVRVTTFAEVKEKNIEVYEIATGDPQQDEEIERSLVKQIAPEETPSSRNTCTEGTGTLGGDYLVKPDDPNSTRVFFEVEYGRDWQCNVFNIKDRSKVSQGTWTWDQTCVRSVDQSCTTRNYTMTTNFSPWLGNLPSANVGSRYTHISARPSGCGIFPCGRPYTQRTYY